LRFVSRYYFEAKDYGSSSNVNDANYKSVVTILYFTSIISTLLIPPAGYFASFLLLHLESFLSSHLNSFNNDHPKISYYLGITDALLKSTTNNEHAISMNILLKDVFRTSGILKIGFITVQIFSIVRLFQYSSEIFQEGFAIIHTLNCIGSEVVSVIVLILLGYNEKIAGWKAFMILDFVFLAYFLPYMAIAFIDSPLQATFVYVLIVIGTVIIFVYFCSGSYALRLHRDKSQLTEKRYFLSIQIFYSNSLFIYSIITVILLLNLGGFGNFGELQERLSWPIAVAAVLAIGGYFLKPKIRPSDNNGNVRPSDNIIVNQLSVQNTDQ